MKISSVETVSSPEGNNGPAKAAIFFQGIYSILGLVAGVVFFVGGLLLILGGVTGSSHLAAEVLGSKIDLPDASAGLICVVFGFLVISITKFEVQVRAQK